MVKVMAMMLAGGRVDELSVLTLFRPKSSVPFGGLYRVIDFPLSNLMHSGIERVGILSQYRPLSLMTHIGSGSSWDMIGRNRGIRILPPFQGYQDHDWYKGTADAVYQNLDFIRYFQPDLVLVLSGDHVYQMDYQPLIQYHLDNEADLTLAFVQVPWEQANRFGLGVMEKGDDKRSNEGGRVIEYLEKPERPVSNWASLTIYLFKRSVLESVLIENAENDTCYEFGRNIIPPMVINNRVYGYKFFDYWGYTRTVDEYWKTNMELLGDAPVIDLEAWKVRTNLDHKAIRERQPTVIGPEADIRNSLIYNGSHINGKVVNSILFPGVRLARGSEVHNSILMFDTQVGEEVWLDKVITDGGVRIDSGCQSGVREYNPPNENYPDLLASGITLVGRDTHLPSGVTIGKNCIIYPKLPRDHFQTKNISSGKTIS